jgi:nicotinamidase-related amidase
MNDKVASITDFDALDPLREQYQGTLISTRLLRQELAKHHVALLCIDLQYLDAARGHGVFADAAASGVPLAAQEYYFHQLETRVLPNVRRLQDAFRAQGLEVIHSRIQSMTRDGRDRSPGHKRLNLHAAPGSKEAEFVESVAPVGDEIVLNKTASGVFNSTNLQYILRNLGITSLFIVGVYSNECVSTAVRDACDLGFYVTLIDDGCTTVTPELQAATIATIKDRYARVMTTDEAIAEIARVREPRDRRGRRGHPARGHRLGAADRVQHPLGVPGLVPGPQQPDRRGPHAGRAQRRPGAGDGHGDGDLGHRKHHDDRSAACAAARGLGHVRLLAGRAGADPVRPAGPAHPGTDAARLHLRRLHPPALRHVHLARVPARVADLRLRLAGEPGDGGRGADQCTRGHRLPRGHDHHPVRLRAVYAARGVACRHRHRLRADDHHHSGRQLHCLADDRPGRFRRDPLQPDGGAPGAAEPAVPRRDHVPVQQPAVRGWRDLPLQRVVVARLRLRPQRRLPGLPAGRPVVAADPRSSRASSRWRPRRWASTCRSRTWSVRWSRPRCWV